MKLRDSSNAMALLLFLVLSVFLFGTSTSNAAQNNANVKTDNSINMLQFKTGNHVLGFTPNKAYIASIDHALSVEFIGTKGVMPKAANSVPSNERGKAQPLGKVTYQNLWPGISLTYESTKDGIAESTYHVAPRADVSNIRLKYNVPVTLQKDGTLKLELESKLGRMTESAPIAWQEINGEKKPVEVVFRVEKDEIGFRVGEYDSKHALIIDPKYNYEWHTFHGRVQLVTSIATDGNGNVYVAGITSYSWNGPGECLYPSNGYTQGTPPCPLRALSGGPQYPELFLIKLNSSGAYQWHTFYGSTFQDEARAIATDTSGNVYVAGRSYATWQGVTNGGPVAPLHAYSGYSDMFLLKLNSSGEYEWHTFYGSSVYDDAQGIVTDTSGNVYVTGLSLASWNGDLPGGCTDPATDNYTQGTPPCPLHLHTYNTYNMFVLKLNSSGIYQWHTFYGDSHNPYFGMGITTDTSNNLYIAGRSAASWLGANDNTPKHAFTGAGQNVRDICVLKLNSSGGYQWHTFYASDNDYLVTAGIVSDASGNVYVAGNSYSTWNGNHYPNGSDDATPIHPFSGSNATEVFVLKLDSGGYYQWHTFYGNEDSHDYAGGIVIDASGSIYVTGYSYGSWQGGDGSVDPIRAYSDASDMFLLSLDSNGAYQWHTFYGGSYSDSAKGIAIDSGGSVYVTGESDVRTGSWNGDGGVLPVDLYDRRGYALYVLKLTPTTPTTTYTVTPSVGANGSISPNTPQTVNYGSTILFTVTPDTGYHIDSVSGCGGSLVGNTYTTGAITSNCTVTASFAIMDYTLTVNSAGTGAGTIASSPAGISYSYPAANTGSANFNYGTPVTLTATSSTGSTVSWSGCDSTGGTTTAAICNVSVTAIKTVTATFTLNTYTITTNPGANGSISCSPNPVNYGSDSTCTITPDVHYHIASVTTDTGSQSATSPHTFTNVTAAHSIAATFATDPADISVSPASPVSFGNVNVNSSSSPQTFTVSNVGYSNLAIGTLSSSNTEFAISNDNCSGQSIAPSGSCTLQVTFSPTTYGSRTSTLSVSSNDPDTPNFNIILNGTGQASNIGVIPASPVDFGSVNVGQSSSAQTFTVSNTGNSNLVIGTISSSNNAEFAISNDNCSGQSIAPSGSCTLQVTFSPTTYGSRTSTLSVSSNDPDTPNFNIILNGTGQASNIGVIPASPVDFGSVNVGQSSSPQTLTVSNTGNSNLVIGTISSSNNAEFVMSNDNCSGQSVAPSGSCTLQVIFSPVANGSRASEMQIPSNDPDAAIFAIALNGAGVQYTVTPLAGEHGSISPNTPQTVNYGSTILFTVTPDAGYRINSVSGCSGSLVGSTYTTSEITANCTVTASFVILDYTLTANSTGTGAGSIASSPPGISYSYPAANTGSANFNYGTSVILTANASTGSTVAWSGGCNSTSGNGTPSATCTVSVTQAKTVTATFARIYCRIVRTSKTYSTLQAAYAEAAENDEIQCMSDQLSGYLSVSRNISLTIGGGYNIDFTRTSGSTTTFKGMIQTQIGGGTLTLKDFIVSQ
jgi:hypothetical protein